MRRAIHVVLILSGAGGSGGATGMNVKYASGEPFGGTKMRCVDFCGGGQNGGFAAAVLRPFWLADKPLSFVGDVVTLPYVLWQREELRKRPAPKEEAPPQSPVERVPGPQERNLFGVVQSRVGRRYRGRVGRGQPVTESMYTEVSMRAFLVSTVLLALGVGAIRAGEPDQEVICVSQRSKVISLFRVNLQTGDAKNLTPEKGPVAFPAISSDGKRVVFAASWDGGQNLYVTDAHGRNPKRITKLSAEQFPTLATWSPDGTRIAYMRASLNRDPEVVVIDADGTNEKVLSDNLGEPCWSPDGKKIAVVTRIGGAFRLGTIDPDGKNLKLFETGAKNTRGQVHPCWAPDGKRIAFSDLIDGAQQIFVCDADGSNVKRVTNIPPDCTSPSWTPDGKRIAFAGHQAKMMGLFFIRPDGTGLEQIDATQLAASVHTGRLCFLPPTPNSTARVRELAHDPKQGGARDDGQVVGGLHHARTVGAETRQGQGRRTLEADRPEDGIGRDRRLRGHRVRSHQRNLRRPARRRGRGARRAVQVSAHRDRCRAGRRC